MKFLFCQFLLPNAATKAAVPIDLQGSPDTPEAVVEAWEETAESRTYPSCTCLRPLGISCFELGLRWMEKRDLNLIDK